MPVHISIGENHRFELREALLIYGDRQRSFVTRHAVTLHDSAPPTLAPAQPLTLGFVESLVRSLSGGSAAEVLPENVLAKGERMIVWWTPRCRRQMFYENSEQKAGPLNGRTFPQPPLVWRVQNGDLNIRALEENKRPGAATTLAVAPYWNLSDDGRVCTGSMRRPDNATAVAIPEWERGFYESAFTHANVGRLTRHRGGFEALWGELADKRKPFPVSTLIQLPQTRSKNKSMGTKPALKPEVAKPAETPKPAPSPEPARPASLFDGPAQEAVSATDVDEEEEILAEAAERDEFGEEDQVEDAA